MNANDRVEPQTPAPLRNPAFLGLMGYRLFTILSYQIVAVAVGWHVYELTNDPWKLGLIGLAEVIPFFCVAPFAGYLVDHLPKRRLGIIAEDLDDDRHMGRQVEQSGKRRVGRLENQRR